MEKKPKISVIMAVYNSEKFLAESIESVLNQTFKEFEFIIIDDASIDKSIEIIKKYKKQNKKIILIKNKTNIGPACSRNKGLNIARGKYIAILDADDISLSKRFGIQYNYLENHKDIFLIGGGAININQHGKQTAIHKPITNIRELKTFLEQKNIIYHPTIMFINEKNNFYRSKFRYSQDYDFYFCLLSKGKIITNIPEILIKYRINSKSISFSKRAKQELFAEKAREFYSQRLKYGIDGYAKFEPYKILSLDVKKTKIPKIISFEIMSNFKLNNLKKTRRWYYKYLRSTKRIDKYIIYYFATFMPRFFIDCIRKILFN